MPAWIGETVQRWRSQYDVAVATRLQLTADGNADSGTAEAPRAGFDEGEQIERVEKFLRSIGLTQGFAPLVLFSWSRLRQSQQPAPLGLRLWGLFRKARRPEWPGFCSDGQPPGGA
jgi:uncharacterized protein YbcC (UPF0753/DUF2309 family)